MSELPPDLPPAREPVPIDSASGIVVRRDAGGRIEVLLGLRSRGTRFLPGHLAFPGGRLEAIDRPGAPGDRARCASREVLEESGVDVPAELWIDAGERVTPPMFPLRFRTRFFVAEVQDLVPPEHPPSPGEIEALSIERPHEVLEAWAGGAAQLPPPVLPILRALAALDGQPIAEVARAVVAANALEQHAPRIEFSPDIWVVPLRTATLPPATHTNAWLPGGRAFAIVDPGSTEPAEIRRLLDVVERRRALGHPPRAVLLTHHHRDHVGGACEVARRLEVPLRAHPATLAVLDTSGVVAEPIHDGEEIDLDGMALQAVHTPGHAAGHLAFRVLGRGELIVGDLVSGLSTIVIDPAGGDMGQYLASLDRVRELGCRTLLPGHGPPLPARAIDELIAHRRERERRVLLAIGEGGASLAEIARSAYDDTTDVLPALAQLQARAHLQHLERSGRVGRGAHGTERWIRTETHEEDHR